MRIIIHVLYTLRCATLLQDLDRCGRPGCFQAKAMAVARLASVVVAVSHGFNPLFHDDGGGDAGGDGGYLDGDKIVFLQQLPLVARG